MTKVDTFPMPRVDGLLDQLGGAEFFTTLDLASGFWQIRVAKESKSPMQGVFEFRVMLFGLINAPAVFQRLMQKVLNHDDDGQEFVAVYMNNVLVCFLIDAQIFYLIL